MRDFVQRYWINALGLLFFFVALLYFLKLAVANGWFPIELRLALSTLLGFSGLFFGFNFHKSGKPIVGQVLVGLGTAVLYATVGYISFSNEIHWSNGAMLVAMVGIGTIVSIISIRQNQRILFALSILGGLITPFIIRASGNMDVPLFIYVFVLNGAALYAGASRGWKENIIGSFLLTIGLFATYYFLFDPVAWTRPFIYASALFLLFLIGFLIRPFKENDRYEGMELFLVVSNGINYVLWSYWIFSSFKLSHVVPFLVIGVLFMALACVIYYRSQKRGIVAVGTYTVLALITLGIAGNDLTLYFWKGGINYVITAAVWLLLVIGVFSLGKKLKDQLVVSVSMCAYLLLLIYWFVHSWSVDWLPIMGIKYIPFLNVGALVWIASILLGFRFALALKQDGERDEAAPNGHAAAIFTMISHIQIGGLLTIQISNLWEAYPMGNLDYDLTLSLSWFVYALVIFAWNSRLPHVLFRYFGGAVLLISSAKVIFFDLGANASLQRIIFLLVLGGLTLLIGKISSQSRKSHPPKLSEEAQN